jgi:hypothetical protein
MTPLINFPITDKTLVFIKASVVPKPTFTTLTNSKQTTYNLKNISKQSDVTPDVTIMSLFASGRYIFVILRSQGMPVSYEGRNGTESFFSTGFAEWARMRGCYEIS